MKPMTPGESRAAYCDTCDTEMVIVLEPGQRPRADADEDVAVPKVCPFCGSSGLKVTA